MGGRERGGEFHRRERRCGKVVSDVVRRGEEQKSKKVRTVTSGR